MPIFEHMLVSFEMVTVDILGSSPKTSNESIYLLLLINTFTKYSEAVPVLV
jgi:hypothetical protein